MILIQLSDEIGIYSKCSIVNRMNRLEVLCQRTVLKKFTIFTEKYWNWSFFNKIAGWKVFIELLQKTTSVFIKFKQQNKVVLELTI